MNPTIAKLLAQKEELFERLHQSPGDNERMKIEALLAKIDTALNFLDSAEPGDPT
jgi:hypothetical protein